MSLLHGALVKCLSGVDVIHQSRHPAGSPSPRLLPRESAFLENRSSIMGSPSTRRPGGRFQMQIKPPAASLKTHPCQHAGPQSWGDIGAVRGWVCRTGPRRAPARAPQQLLSALPGEATFELRSLELNSEKREAESRSSRGRRRHRPGRRRSLLRGQCRVLLGLPGRPHACPPWL